MFRKLDVHWARFPSSFTSNIWAKQIHQVCIADLLLKLEAVCATKCHLHWLLLQAVDDGRDVGRLPRSLLDVYRILQALVTLIWPHAPKLAPTRGSWPVRVRHLDIALVQRLTESASYFVRFSERRRPNRPATIARTW